VVPLRAAAGTALLAALVITASAGPLLAAPPAPKLLRPQPVALAAKGWSAPLFVRSDRAGHVFLLRAERAEVYPLDAAGQLQEPWKLKPTEAALGLVLNAALSPAGDQWLLHVQSTVRLFVDGKERPLPPLDWQPWSVGFRRETPIVAVMPRPLPAAAQRLASLGTAPWLLALEGDRWSALVEHSDLTAERAWRERARMNEWVAEHAVFLAPARDGKLWAARQYAHRVQRLSPSGKTLLDIEVQDGREVKAPARPARDVDVHGRKVPVQAFEAKQAIEDLVEGPGGTLYLLAHRTGKGGLALERYDPVRGLLEEAPLALEGTGRFTLAAGKDGLYLAGFDPTEGLWMLSWEAVQAAPWVEVEGSEAEGKAEPSPAPASRPAS
jgi:hypothetical protein